MVGTDLLHDWSVTEVGLVGCTLKQDNTTPLLAAEDISPRDCRSLEAAVLAGTIIVKARVSNEAVVGNFSGRLTAHLNPSVVCRV